ncbi:MAG TPA: TonB family protein [Thermoanaerobaculia bacterium]
MFETSVVQAQAAAVKSRFSLLTVSLVLHSAAIVGVVAVSIASVEFPTSAPHQFALFQQAMPVVVPPPLGNPNGGKQPTKALEAPKPQPATVLQPTQPTAPSTIPTDVPDVASNATTTSSDAGPGNGTVEGPVGQEWGEPGSIGPLDGPPALPTTQPVVEETIYRAVGEVKPARVLRRAEPAYPEVMRRAGLAATVRIRCIVDKNGNVRDPEIIMSSYPPFNDAVLGSLRQWRFAPGTLRGQPVETWFELTVQFKTR